MLNFNYDKRITKYSEKTDSIIENKYEREPAPFGDILCSVLSNLSDFKKLISLTGGMIVRVEGDITRNHYIGSMGKLDNSARFTASVCLPRRSLADKTDSRTYKTMYKEFDILSAATETNFRQCMADRKLIFQELGMVFDGEKPFFKNTHNAIKLVNDYFEVTNILSPRNNISVENFAELKLGKDWKNNPRSVAYVKVLEATCGVTGGNIAHSYGAIYSSLTEVMEFDREFRADTTPNTKYVENKVDAIREVQENVRQVTYNDTGLVIHNDSVIEVSTVADVLSSTNEEILHDSPVFDPIETPTPLD